MAHAPLFQPGHLGDIRIRNRIIMAPLTRSRSTPDDNLQTDLHATYYAQRASGGLLITEATQISREGQGYAWTPGIFSEAQIDQWQPVTRAVHEAGGKIVCQLWHVGAISHGIFQDGQAPVSSSAWTPKGEAFVGDLHPDGPTLPHPQARALRLDEIPRLIEDFRHAADCARRAGFDGVEVHAANGYLLDQFLRSSVNKRRDQYGGSVENRVRLLVEVVDAVIPIWGTGRVGVRLSPQGGPGGSYDDDPRTVYTAAARALSGKGLAYLHVVRPGGRIEGEHGSIEAAQLMTEMKAEFGGPFIACGGFSATDAAEWVRDNKADAIAFGRSYLANPDLPERIAQNGPYNGANPATFYGGGAEGYTDYPTLPESPRATG